MKAYRLFSLAAGVVFAAVGCLFLFFPDAPIRFFNGYSAVFGLPAAPLSGAGFYLALAAAYMFIVTVLAFRMARSPETDAYPVLLAQAKLASSALSLYLFIAHAPYMIYFANFIVDGLIGICVIVLMKYRRRRP